MPQTYCYLGLLRSLHSLNCSFPKKFLPLPPGLCVLSAFRTTPGWPPALPCFLVINSKQNPCVCFRLPLICPVSEILCAFLICLLGHLSPPTRVPVLLGQGLVDGILVHSRSSVNTCYTDTVTLIPVEHPQSQTRAPELRGTWAWYLGGKSHPLPRW